MRTAGNRRSASRQLSLQLHTSSIKCANASWFVFPFKTSVKVEMRHFHACIGANGHNSLASALMRMSKCYGGWLTLDGYGLKHQNNLICEVYRIARAVCGTVCDLYFAERKVMGSSDSRCYIDVMSQMSIWTLFWCTVSAFLKCIEQFWQQSQTKLRGRFILHAKSVHSCVFVWVGFLYWWRYVSTFYKKTENKNVFHRANVEQQSNRKGVVIESKHRIQASLGI